jgi:hypothetical protein
LEDEVQLKINSKLVEHSMYPRQYSQYQRVVRPPLVNTRTVNPSFYQGSTYNYHPYYSYPQQTFVGMPQTLPLPYQKKNTFASTILLSFFMSLILSFVLSLVNTLINVGLVSDVILIWIRSFAIGLLISFPTALLAISAVRPIVNKMIPT